MRLVIEKLMHKLHHFQTKSRHCENVNNDILEEIKLTNMFLPASCSLHIGTA